MIADTLQRIQEKGLIQQLSVKNGKISFTLTQSEKQVNDLIAYLNKLYPEYTVESRETADYTRLTIQTNFKDMNVVITGTLSSMTRNEAERIIEAQGGKLSKAVSRNTDFLVVGENPGSKLGKARSLGIKVLDETNFNRVVENNK